MESLKRSVLLDFNKNQLHEVRATYGYDVNRLVQDITLFKDWIEKQNHFRVKKFDPEYLERFLIYNKGSIERAKQHFEKLCTSRTLMPEFLQNFDMKNEFSSVRSCCKFAIMPRPTADNYRVLVASIHGYDDKFEIATYYKYVVSLSDYILHYDYCYGWELVFDTREMPYAMITKLNPIVISKALSLTTDTLGQRIKNYHCLSGSKLFNTVIRIFKQGMSENIAKRIRVHDSLESLQMVLDKESLPVEYGGTNKCIRQIDDEVFRELNSKEHISRIKFLESASTDESLRLSCKFNEEYSGTTGSFKTMVLD